MRLGRVQVSCEGYKAPSDPYVLKDSCALTYHLLPAHGSFAGEDDHLRFKGPNVSFQSLLDAVFPVLFIAALGWIIWGFIASLRRSGGRNNATINTGRGGGGGGGGGPGGGWGPGWGPGGDNDSSFPPPPPYSKHGYQPAAGASGSSNANANADAWRPGFWTGLATGAAGLFIANRNRNQRQNTRANDPYLDGGAMGGGIDAGWTGRRGGGAGPSSSNAFAGPSASSSGLSSSAGYGGTRNR